MANGFYAFKASENRQRAANEEAIFVRRPIEGTARTTIAAKAGVKSAAGVEWFWSLCDVDDIPPSLASLAARALDRFEDGESGFCRPDQQQAIVDLMKEKPALARARLMYELAVCLKEQDEVKASACEYLAEMEERHAIDDDPMTVYLLQSGRHLDAPSAMDDEMLIEV